MDQEKKSFVIRQASPFEENALLEIVREIQSSFFYWPDDVFRAELVQAETWVLVQGEKIVAFVCIRDVSEAFEFSVLATRLSCQGQGWMRKLLQKVIEEIGGQRHLWLEVHVENITARNLYEKLGFVHTGTRGAYYRDGSAALLYTRFHC